MQWIKHIVERSARNRIGRGAEDTAEPSPEHDSGEVVRCGGGDGEEARDENSGDKGEFAAVEL
jgi:hypothetical protein